MAYSEELAARVRKIFSTLKNVEEKRMIGGLTFMLNDKMCAGILNDDLMIRIDPDEYDNALKKPGCRQMDFTGKPMKGFVLIGTRGTKDQKDLKYWVGLAIEYNPKAKSSKKKKKK